MTPIRNLTALAATVMALALPAMPQAARAAQVQLALVTAPATLLPGALVAVTVLAEADGTDLLLGGGFSLGFDAGLLDLVEVSLHAPSDVAGSTGTLQVDGDLGTVAGIGFASFAGVGGRFELASLRFRARGPQGVSTITAFDAQDLVYAWASESLRPVTVLGASSLVSVVPEPGSLAMLLLGAGVVGWSAGRQRRCGCSFDA